MSTHLTHGRATCRPHAYGVPPGTPPFYVKGCRVCEQKRAAGLVTGKEGPPRLPGDVRYRRRGFTKAEAQAMERKGAAVRKGRRAAYGAWR